MTTGTAIVARQSDLALAGPLGSLDAYLDRVSRIPVLSREEERQLAERFRRQDDLGAARELVVSHLRFVVHIARGYSGYGLPVGDLIQEGNVGLMKAVKRFDPALNLRRLKKNLAWLSAEETAAVARDLGVSPSEVTEMEKRLAARDMSFDPVPDADDEEAYSPAAY